ncbi:hypothetical protein [Nocardiopsis suaedae]|uniref:Uncharacterized protein n=1 Tax=Nocardiopsis suaedae TaxID=3018444 RepID=A0ABT4TES3_9ACTN|nr:hypothetical protein [Nocardiopsis suaedae]MDA2803203.1 hypothetical protein [Nocardiopsis suaedae]
MAFEIHHPGRPEDLSPAPMLWAHGVLGAATAAAAPWEALHLYSLDDEGLLMDPEDGTWWRLTWFAEDTAVLTGNEPLGYECTEYRGLVDKLAGAPDRLPIGWLGDMLRVTTAGEWEPSFLYWWIDGDWGRTEYPEGIRDDGLCTVDGMGTPERLQRYGCVGAPSLESVTEILEAAAAGALAPSSLEAFMRACGVEDPAPALRVAAEGGLTPDAPRPVLKVT